MYTAWTDAQLEMLADIGVQDTPFTSNGQITDIDLHSSLAEQDAAENQLKNMLSEALDPQNVIPPDLKFDDRDLPQAANFYEFCMNPDGLDQPPLARQLVIFTHLFGEWCVSGDTLVQTNQGLVQIQDIQGESSEYSGVKGLEVSTREGNKSVADCGMTQKMANVLFIEDANGHRLKCTPNHRIQVLNEKLEMEWVRAENLKVGDYVVSVIGNELWGQEFYPLKKRFKPHLTNGRQKDIKRFNPPEYVTHELARFIGYTLSDGWHDGLAVGLINTDKSIIDDYCHVVKTLFNVEPVVTSRNPVSKAGTVCKTTYTAKVNYKTVSDYLQHIGFPVGNCYDKIIPDFILRSDRQTVIECIRSIIDCDGYIQGYDEDHSRRVGIKCASVKMMQQLHLLLNNMGIYNTLQYAHNWTTKYGKEEAHCHEVAQIEIKWEFADRYIEQVGSLHSEKSLIEPLGYEYEPDKVNAKYGRVRPGNVPHGKSVFKQMQSFRTEYNEYMGKPTFWRSDTWHLNHLKGSDLIEWNKEKKTGFYERIKYLYQKQFAFAKVTKIETLDEQIPVYDLRVPDGENFVANGMVVHNCPHCSHEMFHDIKDFPVDYPVKDVKEHVTFLEWGKCPNCGSTRSELIHDGLLKDYAELALCCGQRCVTADTIILTEDGMVPIGKYIQDRPYGYSWFEKVVATRNGRGKTQKFYRAEKESLINITTSGGRQLKGTKDHPVMTDSGFVKMGKLKVDSWVQVRHGQNMFGKLNSDCLFDIVSNGINCHGIDQIMQSQRSVILAWLHGLFDRAIVSGNGILVQLKDYETANKVQVMLLNIGIPAVITPNFGVMITGETALYKFEQEVGFMNFDLSNSVKGFDWTDVNTPFYDLLPPNIQRKVLQLLIHAMAQIRNIDEDAEIDLKIPNRPTITKSYLASSVASFLRDWGHVFDDITKAGLETYVAHGNDNCWWERVTSLVHTMPEETYDITVQGEHNFISNGILSHNSGKSIGTSLANAYIIHRYLKLQNPTRVYGLTKNTNLTGTFVGLTFGRAKSLLFEPMADLIGNSQWFRWYHQIIEDAQQRFGEEVYHFGKEMIVYKHRRIAFYPASPNKRNLRGDTRLLCGVDELGWFPFGEESNDRERAGADEVYEALDRSMLTIRLAYDDLVAKGYDNIPNAYGIFASSPSAYNDKIMSLVRTFEGSDTALGAQFPSWEMNPAISRNSKAIRKAYQENHIKAERDYGANPPLADSAFIPDPTEFKHCFTKKKNLLGRYKYVQNVRGNGTRRAAKFTTPLPNLPGILGPAVMALDAGSSNNSFGITVGGLGKNNRPRIFGMMEIAPGKRRPLDHNRIYHNTILPAIKAFGVVRVYVDRWQSLKIIHDIENDTKDLPYEVQGVEYSLRRSDFDFVLDFMQDKDSAPVLPKLENEWEEVMNKSASDYPHCFKYEPVSHMLFQMATVRETARTVDKGQGYTDDIFRSMFLALAHLYDEDVQDELSKVNMTGVQQKTKRNAIATVRYSGGGNTSRSGSSSNGISKYVAMASRGR